MKSIKKYMLILVASLALLLAGCGGGGSTPPTPPDTGPSPAQEAIMQAETALMNAENALDMLTASATDTEKRAAYQAVQQAADNLVTALTTHGGSAADIAAAASKSGNAEVMAENLAQKIADDAVAAEAAMAALATKLFDAIGTDPLDQNESGTTGGTTGTRVDDTGDLFVQVRTPGDDGDLFATNKLKEDETAMVAPLHGWTGSKHTATVAAGTNSGAGTYTAHLYADIEAPKQGKKFGGAAANDEYEYGLTNKAISFGGGGVTPVPARIAFTDVTRTAGTETFKLPESNPGGLTNILVPGSYHGVSGTYSCDTGSGRDQTCTAAVAAAGGFTLGGTGAWTFTPTDPNDRVMSAPDTVYPVYGWWQHEASNGTTRVSAFTGYRGDAGSVNLSTTGSGSVNLNGTASYKGGAAGIYALQSSTGGTNDAGHFTADAELTATFKGGDASTIDHKITGTIDNFMDSNGMPRDWSVALKETEIGLTGFFPGTGAGETTWSIGGTAAGESGEWKGRLYKQNDGGVPTVGTGTFYTTYDRVGRMVGAFGANLEE